MVIAPYEGRALFFQFYLLAVRRCPIGLFPGIALVRDFAFGDIGILIEQRGRVQ